MSYLCGPVVASSVVCERDRERERERTGHFNFYSDTSANVLEGKLQVYSPKHNFHQVLSVLKGRSETFPMCYKFVLMRDK